VVVVVVFVNVITTSLHNRRHGFHQRSVVRVPQVRIGSIVSTSDEDYHPLTNVGDDSPIEFDINGTGEDYIDLASTMLLVRAKTLQPDSTNIDDDTPVGPTNLWLHSLFSVSML